MSSAALLLVSSYAVFPRDGRAQERCVAPLQPWTVAVLYFGSDIQSGGVVSDQDFQKFEDQVVVPRFPDRTTLTEGVGRYRYKDGSLVAEHTRIITFFMADASKGGKLLDQIIESYKTRFRQEAVARDQRNDCLAFQ